MFELYHKPDQEVPRPMAKFSASTKITDICHKM